MHRLLQVTLRALAIMRHELVQIKRLTCGKL